MGLFRLAVLIFSIFLSAGCASVSELQNELSSKTGLVNSYAEMSAQPISASSSFAINKDFPVFNFEEGKSYYLALGIPDSGQPRQLKFKSYVSTAYLPSANIFVPHFVYLDEHKEVIGQIKSYRFTRGTDFWLGGFYEGYVIVPAKAAYVVIYTSDSPTPELSSFSENGREWPLPHAPTGKLAFELSNPFPVDHDFSTVLIQDSVTIYSNSKADFFYVTKINDKEVENSLINTRKLNAGRGLSMTPRLIDREIPVEPVTLSIAGRTHYAAPILALTNSVYEIKGQIDFVPQKNRSYTVRGELGENHSVVWVEDDIDHQVMGKKIEVNGPSKLGILQK